MSEDILFKVFDAWEPLLKARKAKGVEKWDRLQNVATKLQGKDMSAISFTCAHPSHGGQPVKHLLGSIEGNLHFMLGYGNPDFHLAPYHWQIIDPNTTEEEAIETAKRIAHPSNPMLWAKAGITASVEGDTAEGVAQTKSSPKPAAKEPTQSLKAKSPTGSYTCVPSEGLVYGDHNGHVYRWDLIKDSFFSALNPDVAEAMNSADTQKSLHGVSWKSGSPEPVKKIAAGYRGMDFEPDVWPLVKSRCPKPGTIIKLMSDTAETIYGVVSPNSIEFYSRSGQAEIEVFNTLYKSFDLVPGNVPPAALLAFVVDTFGVSASLLHEVTTSTPSVEVVKSVDGEPTPGFEDVPSYYVEGLTKSIVAFDDGLRVVVES